MLAFVSRVQVIYEQVAAYHTKGYFEKLHPAQKKRKKKALKNFKKQTKTGIKYDRGLHFLLHPPRKIGSFANLCCHSFANIMLKAHWHEYGDGLVASLPFSNLV